MIEVSKLVETLRERADSDELAAGEIDPLHYTPDDPVDIAAGLEFLASERRECADMLEKQAAVIAEQGHTIARYMVELEIRAQVATPLDKAAQ